MSPIPSLPHVRFAFNPHPVDGLIIECACSHCGDRWERRCDYPERRFQWVARFANLHQHGVKRGP
jgi:hypothetical protein